MPRQLALFVFIILILIIFIINYKKARYFRSVEWPVILWLLSTQSKELAYYFKYDTTMESGSPYDRAFLLLIGTISLIILRKRDIKFSTILKNNYILISLFCYMLLSSLWSYNSFFSIRNLIKQMMALIIGILISSDANPKELLLNSYKKSLYIALPISLMLIKYYPEFGRRYGSYSGELTWIGITGQKNDLAIMCSFASIFLIWSLWVNLILKDKPEKKIITAIDFAILLLAIHLMLGPQRKLTTSSTSFLTLIIGLISVLILNSFAKRHKVKKQVIAIILITIITLGTLLPFVEIVHVGGIAKILQRDETLTGRTMIWNSLKTYALKKLIFGYGFAGFWSFELRESIASSAHNGYLDTILNIGIIGLILLAIFYAQFGIRCASMVEKAGNISILCITMIIMSLIHNISESTITYTSAFPSSLLILLYFMINVMLKSSSGDNGYLFKYRQ